MLIAKKSYFIIDRQMIKKLVFIIFTIILVSAVPADDRVNAPPGFINTTIYSGYLKTATPNRLIHYVFIEAANTTVDPLTAPLTIWFNGGPGCSSLIGMLQEIGPYIVGNTYKLGDMLTKNQYSWHKISNLLFLESPAVVGFSTDKDSTYHWTDQQTAKDAFEAIKDFIFNKAPQFKERNLFISGESYAGKYVPDVTSLILDHNMHQPASQYIHIKGIMVGNGVMNFANNQLDKSQIQYMIDHQVISSRLQVIYHRACRVDFHSPRCRFFRFQVDILQSYLNPYDIYQVCQDKPTQAIRLREAMSVNNEIWREEEDKYQRQQTLLGQIPDCPSDNGAIQYWNLNKYAYKVDQVNKTWQVCSRLHYTMTQTGSMPEYRRILLNGGVRVWLFSGDWDDVVPFTDTQKNVQELHKQKTGDWTAWNVGDHHAGFYQNYEKGFTVITVKGASHMVPQTRPKPSYQLFYNFINNKGVNNQVF